MNLLFTHCIYMYIEETTLIDTYISHILDLNQQRLNKEMVDKIHSQNNIFLIGISHRSTLFLSKIILIQISLSKNAETKIDVHLSQLLIKQGIYSEYFAPVITIRPAVENKKIKCNEPMGYTPIAYVIRKRNDGTLRIMMP